MGISDVESDEDDDGWVREETATLTPRETLGMIRKVSAIMTIHGTRIGITKLALFAGGAGALGCPRCSSCLCSIRRTR